MSISVTFVWPWADICRALCWRKISVTQCSRVTVCPLQFTFSETEGQMCVNTLKCLSGSLTSTPIKQQWHSAIFHSWTRLAFTLLHGFFPPVCLQLMLLFYVKPLLEYHWVITLTLVISVTYNCNCLWLFWQGTFHYLVICETDFFFLLPSCSDSRQSREHRGPGWGVERSFMFIFKWSITCIHSSLSAWEG